MDKNRPRLTISHKKVLYLWVKGCSISQICTILKTQPRRIEKILVYSLKGQHGSCLLH